MKVEKTQILLIATGLIIIISLTFWLIMKNKKKEGYASTTMAVSKLPLCKSLRQLDHEIYGNILCYEDDAISNYISNGAIWEEHICQILADYYIPGTDYLDIGANLGLNSLRMHKIKPITGTVHLFEPQPDVFLMCKHNTRQLSRKLYNLCLSDKAGALSFDQNVENVGATTITYNNGETTVACLPLDNFDFSNKVSLVKMDVEGAEENVLEGAKIFFEKHQPMLVIEIWQNNLQKVNMKLAEMNYVLIKKIGGDDYIYQYV